MRILTISNYYPSHPGGIEIVAQNLVTRWRINHQVRWAACEVSSHPHEYEPDDVPLHASNITETRLGFPYPIPTAGSVIDIFRQVQWCEVVHIHDCLYFANIVAFIASSFFSKPLVVTQHVGMVPYRESYKNVLQKLAYQTIGRLVLQGSDEVIFINENIRKWFEAGANLTKVFLIQNGVDHQVFFPANADEQKSARIRFGLPETGVVLLFVGRFTQKKGVDLIHKIAAARPDYTWVMVGSGEIDISTWDLPNTKVFPRQPQTVLREFYIAADLFVLPSKGEGFPLVVQEALSCGVPAAVSEETASSLPEAPLISLDIDEMPSLLGTLDSALKNAEFLASLRERSKEFSKIWDWDAIARQYEDHFIHLVNK